MLWGTSSFPSAAAAAGVPAGPSRGEEGARVCLRSRDDDAPSEWKRPKSIFPFFCRPYRRLVSESFRGPASINDGVRREPVTSVGYESNPRIVHCCSGLDILRDFQTIRTLGKIHFGGNRSFPVSRQRGGNRLRGTARGKKTYKTWPTCKYGTRVFYERSSLRSNDNFDKIHFPFYFIIE